MMIAYNNMIHRLIVHLYTKTNSLNIKKLIKSLLLVYYNRKIYLNELYNDIIDTLHKLNDSRPNNSYTKKNMTRIFEIKFTILKNYINIHIHLQTSNTNYNRYINAIGTIYANIKSNTQNTNSKKHSIIGIINNIDRINKITYNIMKIPNDINITYINLIYHIIKLIINEQHYNNNVNQITILINLLMQNEPRTTTRTWNTFTIDKLIKYLTQEIDTLLKVYAKSDNNDLINRFRSEIKSIFSLKKKCL
jgi:hypothetical protein